MHIGEISEDTLNKIKPMRFDLFIEKHEGPFEWSSFLKYYDIDFFDINDFNVLLPLDKSRHANIKIRRCIVSEDQQTLTVFLTDSTFESNPYDGYVAICDKVIGEVFYLTVFYHEWYVI